MYHINRDKSNLSFLLLYNKWLKINHSLEGEIINVINFNDKQSIYNRLIAYY